MGCDIHDYMETRENEGSPWCKVGKIFPNPYYREGEENRVYPDEESGPYESNPEKIEHPFDVRNYNLFAVLADVRNGRGTAGCEIGSYITPIAMPKGLPDDVSSEIKKFSNYWGVDGHSHSWLMIRELAEYDWDQPHYTTGVLTLQQYEQMLQGVEPQMWSGGISGPGIVTISELDYQAFLASGELPRITERRLFTGDHELFPGGKPGPDIKIYVQARWDSGGVRGAIGDSSMRVIAQLCDAYDWDNTRLVFWFDN